MFRIAEHSAYGSFVGGVHATDKDITKTSNGLIKYSLKPLRSNGRAQRDPWFHFFKVSSDGVIHFYGNESKLDRESDHESPISFLVVAKDSGSPSLSDQKVVKIYLIDINDNAPIVMSPNVTKDIAFVQIPTSMDDYYTDDTGFSDAMATEYRQYPNKFTSSVVIDPEAYNQESLTSITAVDMDEGENAHVSYAITNGNDRKYFAIDHKSGNISFSSDVDFAAIEKKCHVLKILVRDLGEKTMSTYAWVSAVNDEGRGLYLKLSNK